MATLPLAVAIADTMLAADQQQRPVEVEAHADTLLSDHPGAGATRQEVIETLILESISLRLPVALGRAA